SPVLLSPATGLEIGRFGEGRKIMGCGAIGFLASTLVLATFTMKDMRRLRIVAICSNFAFIAYGLALSLPPVWLLHVVLLPLNVWRLSQAWHSVRPTGGWWRLARLAT